MQQVVRLLTLSEGQTFSTENLSERQGNRWLGMFSSELENVLKQYWRRCREMKVGERYPRVLKAVCTNGFGDQMLAYSQAFWGALESSRAFIISCDKGDTALPLEHVLEPSNFSFPWHQPRWLRTLNAGGWWDKEWQDRHEQYRQQRAKSPESFPKCKAEVSTACKKRPPFPDCNKV